MTYAADLAAVQQHDVVHTLFIDGIPILFGTRAGIVYDNSDATLLNIGTLTSNDALDADSLSIGGEKLDLKMGMVPPGSASLNVAIGGAWDTYLRRRGTEYYLTADVTESATTLNLNTVTGIAENDYLFINRETVKVTSVGASSVDVTRNSHALAAASRGGAQHSSGAIVSTCPRYLFGRLAQLRTWLGSDQSVVTRLLYMSGSPSNDLAAGFWSLAFDGAIKMLDRKIAVGFSGSPCRRLGPDLDPSHWPYLVEVINPREFRTASEDGYVAIWDADGNVAIEPIHGYGLAGDAPYIGAHYALGRLDLDNVVDARRCYVFDSGRPMEVALKVLLSDRGLGAAAGTNDSTWDVLFGITATSASATRRVESTETECRFGAAVPAGMVDVTTLETFKDITVPGFHYVLGVNGEEDLLDLLENVAWALNGFWHFNASGQLTFSQYQASNAMTSAASITSAHYHRASPLQCVDDESEILHTVTIKCNLDPVGGDYLGTCTTIHNEDRKTYRDVDGTYEVERGCLYVSLPGQSLAEFIGYMPTPSTIGTDTVRQMLDRIYARRNRGIRRYRLHLPWTFHQLKPGDIITVTHDILPAFDGSTVTTMPVEIVSVSLNPASSDSPVLLDVQDTWSTKRVSPTCRIASISTATLTLTTSSRWDSSTFATTPGRWFAAGWKVRLFDKSASPPYSVTTDAVVSSVTDTTVILTGAPSFGGAAIADGDLICQDTYDDATSTTANVNQGFSQHDYAFGCSSSILLGTADAAHTYG